LKFVFANDFEAVKLGNNLVRGEAKAKNPFNLFVRSRFCITFASLNNVIITKSNQYEKSNEGSSSHNANDGGRLYRRMYETR
jgi:hypothetical protein